jgi:putative SOS response-associated peptidase YedK
MCGRYSLAPEELSEIHLAFDVEPAFELVPRYNIAPTWRPGYEAPIVVQHAGSRALERARWWFIPEGWSRALKGLPTSFNARAEELAQRPFWAESFRSRRCLVPATGWREFSGEPGQRRAFQFHYGRELFAFAGLYSHWKSPEGEDVESFAIITVPANSIVSAVHDRMPLRVQPAQYAAWLDAQVPAADALAAVRAAPEASLEHYESDPIGNDVRREGPEVIAPVPQLGLFGPRG